MRTKIVNYDRLEQSSFDEQINKVIEELEKNEITIKDIKIMNEKKILIMFSINKFI